MKSVFAQYAIMDEVVHEFSKSPGHFWRIKPVNSGIELEYSKFLLHNRVVRERGHTTELPPTWVESAHREIALTFAGTNIPANDEAPVEEGGDPVLAEDASIEEVERILRIMPQEMVYEIWRAVGEAYPRWGPVDPNALVRGETSVEPKTK